jgi:hypothetical protein
MGAEADRPTDGRIKAAAYGPVGRLRTVGRSVAWHDVRYCATAWILEKPKQHQPRLHIACWQRHDRGRRSPGPRRTGSRQGRCSSRQAIHCPGAGGGREGRRVQTAIRRRAWQHLRSWPGGELRRCQRPDRSVARRYGQGKGRTARDQAGAARAHLEYLRRDGVTKEGAPGRMFDAEHDSADHREFAERCAGDRHHFRFIV